MPILEHAAASQSIVKTCGLDFAMSIFPGEEETARRGTFYLKPEYDFLYLLKNTYYPDQIDLFNLAIGGITQLICLVKPSDVSAGVREPFVQALKMGCLPIQRTKYQFILTFTPPFGQFPIYDHESAKGRVQKEDDEWTGRWKVDDNVDGTWATRKISSDSSTCRYPIGALYGKYKNEDLEKAVKPVFGFWMFPVSVDDDVSGKLPSSDDELNQVSTK